MPDSMRPYVLSMLAGLLLSNVGYGLDLQCSGCRSLEDAARVGSGYLWEKGNGFAGVLPPLESLNQVRLVNEQLGIAFDLELSVGWFGVSLGPLGSLTFLSTLSREFLVVDNQGARLKGAYTLSELDLNASLWRLASHVGFRTAVAIFSEPGGWYLKDAPFTDLTVIDQDFGLSLSFEQHYNYQPNVITTVTECYVANCGLSTVAQAPGGSLTVPLPSEDPKDPEH